MNHSHHIGFSFPVGAAISDNGLAFRLRVRSEDLPLFQSLAVAVGHNE